MLSWWKKTLKSVHFRKLLIARSLYFRHYCRMLAPANFLWIILLLHRKHAITVDNVGMITFYSLRYFVETPVKIASHWSSAQNYILGNIELLSNTNTLSQVFDTFFGIVDIDTKFKILLCAGYENLIRKNIFPVIIEITFLILNTSLLFLQLYYSAFTIFGCSNQSFIELVGNSIT